MSNQVVVHLGGVILQTLSNIIAGSLPIANRSINELSLNLLSSKLTASCVFSWTIVRSLVACAALAVSAYIRVFGSFSRPFVDLAKSEEDANTPYSSKDALVGNLLSLVVKPHTSFLSREDNAPVRYFSFMAEFVNFGKENHGLWRFCENELPQRLQDKV